MSGINLTEQKRQRILGLLDSAWGNMARYKVYEGDRADSAMENVEAVKKMLGDE